MTRGFRYFSAIMAICFLVQSPRTGSAQTRAEVAASIRDHRKIQLADSHVSGKADNATAALNIADTAKGQPAKRSSYENAPGGSVELNLKMLKGMLALANTYSFRVSEIAGGSHTKNSRHYAGVAFDIDQINGQQVSNNNPSFRDVMKLARKLGATEVLGPGDAGHDHHVHVAWPRP
jgi:zinc D-Ala-D-Ala carboxypeptidase